MTDEELDALRHKAKGLLDTAVTTLLTKVNREVRKDLHRRYDDVMDKILREENRRADVARANRKKRRASSPTCPTCGQEVK